MEDARYLLAWRRERQMGKLGAATLAAMLGLIVCFSTPVNSDLTFAQWASGPPDKRAIYTAGVLETVGVYAEVLGFVGQWAKCLQELKLSYGAVAEGALEYAKKHRNLDSQPTPAVLIAYMNERCGFTVLRR
jgi:hypothetical protein